MSGFDNLLNRHFAYRGASYTFRGVAPNGLCMFTDGAHGMLEVADPETGLPVWPTAEQARHLMAQEKLILRSCPLADATRRLARQQEPTREELVNAKTKPQGKGEEARPRDRWYTLREQVMKKVDEVGQPPLSVAGVRKFFEDNFDVEALKAQYGRLPSDFAVRQWVDRRGLPRDRRPADFASFSGIVRRRRRIKPVVLAIIKVWALKCHSGPKKSKSSYFLRARDDVQRYAEGRALEIHDFEPVPLDPTVGSIKMCSRRIFDMEVERAKGAQAFQIGHGTAARRQRFGGGGVAQDPTRYLEIVQIDDTPFPVVFVIDPVRGVPCGVPTVTIALCIYTRVILGWDISFDPPSHVTYMSTLLHTALPKSVPEPFARIKELGDLHGKVVGTILLDNAKHQTARAAQDAGGDIGTAVRWAGKKQPTHKGHVESCLNTLQDMVREELKGSTWDIPLMREFDYDPAKHAIVTIEKFREIFAAVVADYHTKGHTELNTRPPLDVWLEQRSIHGHDTVGDIDHFRRAIGNVSYPSFRGQGAEINGLMYGSDGSDDEFPLSNEDILFNLGMARGVATDAKVRTFGKVKIKWDPSDLGHAWLFDELNREYVKIPCTRRRYATGLSLWLHLRIKAWAKERKAEFDTDFEMAAVREEYRKWFSRILPEGKIADQHATARLIDSSEGRRYLGDAVEILRIQSSPTGTSNEIPHELRDGTRGDATRIAPRSSNRNGDEGKPSKSRARKTTTDPVHKEQEEVARNQTRRLGFSSGWDSDN
ncbi:hypothetical protein [Novosphingobium rosa]|uniref:hypothetical protein n=1 Tax=Novosphingobium rosa TaxID=76978 RepID=UPI0008369B1B|nr:hypothetical protein [Novosphingobium rosa]